MMNREVLPNKMVIEWVSGERMVFHEPTRDIIAKIHWIQLELVEWCTLELGFAHCSLEFDRFLGNQHVDKADRVSNWAN